MKVAILGCEHMHAHSYENALKKLEDVEVTGVAEKDKESGMGFAKTYGIKYYEDYTEILKEDIEAVVICSANSRHKEMTVAAARAGKHILVEKPIATTMEDAQEMIDECKKNNVKLMVAFPVRYAPPIARTKEIIDNGELGEIVAIAGTNHGTMPGSWFIDKELSGGGAVMDHTVHVADLMHWMLKSDIKDVYCKMGTKIYDIPVEDCGLLSMEFKNGTYATLDASWNRPESFPTWGDVTMEIIGTKGTVNVDAFAQHGNLYSNNMKYSSQAGWGDNMDFLMIKDFVKCVREDLPSPVTGEDGMFALKVALMAYKAAEKNEVVTSL
jgi:predicted dehydrogenase